MVSTVTPDVRIFPDVQALSRAAAQSLVERIRATVKSGARFFLALAGGNTPRALYRLLATEYRDAIRWDQVHLFWGDERCVPWDDPKSNYRMVRGSLLDHVPISETNVHPMPTDFPEPEDAARAYERTLQNYFSPPWPRFTLVLLGLGPDGHTASLFPGSPVLEEEKRWVVAAKAPAEPRRRLTLTLPVLTHSAAIYFLVAGADKATALHRALAETPDPKNCPAAGVRLGHASVTWWTDSAAVACLHRSSYMAGSTDV